MKEKKKDREREGVGELQQRGNKNTLSMRRGRARRDPPAQQWPSLVVGLLQVGVSW